MSSARSHHESQWHGVLDALREQPLVKLDWEEQNKGARLAPSIDVLRNGLGFSIVGRGTKSDPYRMVDPTQTAQRVLVDQRVKEIYYATEHWQSIREQRIEMDNERCCLCGVSYQLQVHHWQYNILRESVFELMTLCESCHEFIHSVCRFGWPRGIPLDVAKALGLTGAA